MSVQHPFNNNCNLYGYNEDGSRWDIVEQIKRYINEYPRYIKGADILAIEGCKKIGKTDTYLYAILQIENIVNNPIGIENFLHVGDYESNYTFVNLLEDFSKIIEEFIVEEQYNKLFNKFNWLKNLTKINTKLKKKILTEDDSEWCLNTFNDILSEIIRGKEWWKYHFKERKSDDEKIRLTQCVLQTNKNFQDIFFNKTIIKEDQPRFRSIMQTCVSSLIQETMNDYYMLNQLNDLIKEYNDEDNQSSIILIGKEITQLLNKKRTFIIISVLSNIAWKGYLDSFIQKLNNNKNIFCILEYRKMPTYYENQRIIRINSINQKEANLLISNKLSIELNSPIINEIVKYVGTHPKILCDFIGLNHSHFKEKNWKDKVDIDQIYQQYIEIFDNIFDDEFNEKVLFQRGIAFRIDNDDTEIIIPELANTFYQKYKIEKNDYDVFICYKHDDIDIVKKIMNKLIELGINSWYDEGIIPGSHWQEVIGNKIDEIKCLLILARNELTEFQNREIQYAQKNNYLRIPAVLPEGSKDVFNNISFSITQYCEFKNENDSETYQKITKAINLNKSLQVK